MEDGRGDQISNSFAEAPIPEHSSVEKGQEMVDKVPEFEYTEQLSKSSIRLISFNESEDDEIRLSLEEFSFPGAPPYHALSYTWYSPYDFPNLELRPDEEEGLMAQGLTHQYGNEIREIFVNGRILKVGLSLFEALERLENGLGDGVEQQKYLWADAICINQKNNDEKMKQVLLMGDIYKQASSVIAWLGPPLYETHLALGVISEMGKIHVRQLEEMKRLRYDDPAAYTQLGIRNITEREWRAFCGFSRRTWFSRIWVVQECFFARELVLVVGEAAIIFKMGMAYVSFLLWQSSWADEILQPYYHLFSLGVKTGSRISSFVSTVLMESGDSPLAVFSNFRGYGATDPLDKVYALLNVIASRCNKKPFDLPILPDYKKKLPEVLLEATRYCLSFHADLRFFWYIENEQHRRLPECPSWTIDLPKIMIRYPFALAVSEEDSWNPSGKPVRETPDNSTPNLLKFKAAKACSIVQLSDGTIFTTQDVFDFRSFVAIALHLDPEYGTDMGQGITEILWRTVTADRAAGVHPAPSQYAPAVIVFFVDDILRRAETSPETKATDEFLVSVQLQALHRIDPGTIMPTGSELMALIKDGTQLTAWQTETQAMVASTTNAVGNRRLARTSSNHLGLVPSNARVDDEIWAIPGMPTPFVFRRLESGHHEIIGEAYVHGIMRGELADKLELQEVILE